MEREGVERTVRMVERPWLPVAPKTVRSFLEDMVVRRWIRKRGIGRLRVKLVVY